VACGISTPCHAISTDHVARPHVDTAPVLITFGHTTTIALDKTPVRVLRAHRQRQMRKAGDRRRRRLDLGSAMSAELELIAAGYPAASADSARAASRLAPKLAYD